jgi:hypothetical protein
MLEETNGAWFDISFDRAVELAQYLGVDKETLEQNKQVYQVASQDGKLYFAVVRFVYLTLSEGYGVWQYYCARKE